MNIHSSFNVHNVHKIVAYSQYGLGAPLILNICADDGSYTSVTLFTNDEKLNNRLIDAIASAQNVTEEPDPDHAAAHDAQHHLQGDQ